MGNCLQHESSMQWGGDDWGSMVPDKLYAPNAGHEIQEKATKVEEERLLGENRSFTTSSTTSRTEVKIKITKKQLEELLGKADIKELSVQQILARLIKVGDGHEMQQQPWKPNLQSIPE